MKRAIRLAPDFALPLELVTESVAIIVRWRAIRSPQSRELSLTDRSVTPSGRIAPATRADR